MAFCHLVTNWEHIIAGDKEEYAKTYLYLFDRFFNYGFKFTRDAGLVEDAIQEVLEKLWTDRKKLKRVANPAAYLFTSFRNELLRKIKSPPALHLDDTQPAPVVFGHDAVLIGHEQDDQLRQRLQQAVDQLSPRQKEAIFLRFYEGLSYEEVAGILGITHKATYKLMARALSELRSKMGLPLASILMLLQHHATLPTSF
ncbi:RNA polymerase sigma factor [Niabella insulamsoli]|uniref:RNA polymerase sigma factor n=1 Tax=Niabella insulamsoli TaxID=3144874 RepID=UPI0031FDB522